MNKETGPRFQIHPKSEWKMGSRFESSTFFFAVQGLKIQAGKKHILCILCIYIYNNIYPCLTRFADDFQRVPWPGHLSDAREGLFEASSLSLFVVIKNLCGQVQQVQVPLLEIFFRLTFGAGLPHARQVPRRWLGNMAEKLALQLCSLTFWSRTCQ